MTRAARTPLGAGLVAAVFGMLPGCISEWERWEPRIVGYICTAEAEGAYGRISTHSFLSADGARVRYMFMWTAEAKGGLSFRMDWRGALRPPPPGTRLRITIERTRGDRRWVRLEMRRGGPGGPRDYSTSFFRPPFDWSERIRWSRLAEAFGDADELDVALVARGGQRTTGTVLPRAILSAPDEALAAVRPELDADLADFANRCNPEHDPPLVIA